MVETVWQSARARSRTDDVFELIILCAKDQYAERLADRFFGRTHRLTAFGFWWGIAGA